MKQREITDRNGITWTCVQAFSGTGEKHLEEATKLTETENQKVPVVCTPDGGAQTKRIRLMKNWIEEMPDEVLLEKISESTTTGS